MKNEHEITYRTNIYRVNDNFDDLSMQVLGTYYTYNSLEKFLSPWVSRNHDNINMLNKDFILEKIKPHINMNSIMSSRMIESTVNFYVKNKGMKKLHIATPLTHRSIHLGNGLFNIEKYDTRKWMIDYRVDRRHHVYHVHKIDIVGADAPFFVENLREDDYKYAIIRPRLSQLGAVNLKRWEIILSTKNKQYDIEHIDIEYFNKNNGMLPNLKLKNN